jgi:hypothetical protein
LWIDILFFSFLRIEKAEKRAKTISKSGRLIELIIFLRLADRQSLKWWGGVMES